MAIPYPDTFRINNAVYSYNSCRTIIALMEFNGLVGIDFDQAIERELVYGQTKAGAPIGRTEGKYTPSAKLTLLRASWTNSLFPLLTTMGLLQGNVDYGRVEFPVQVQYTHRQLGTHTIDFVSCVLAKVSDTNQVGTEGAKTEIELSVMDILIDGYSMHGGGLL